ncbi:unnamed protein product, partial [Fusarium graminearum]
MRSSCLVMRRFGGLPTHTSLSSRNARERRTTTRSPRRRRRRQSGASLASRRPSTPPQLRVPEP